jgi:hypothetical protein
MSDTKADPTEARTDPDQTADPGDTQRTSEGSGQREPGKDGADPDDNDGSEDEDPPSTEAYKKLEAKATRREQKLREAQAKIKELEAKDSDTPEVSAEDRANQKLVRASAKTVLAGAGITDRADQSAVLELINLSDIEVDDSGDPDEDEISDRIERLRKVFGGKVEKGRRTPARQTTDRGGNGGNSDPDSARYRAFLNG